MSRIICYGEVLWDIFPAHKKIGGAPLNVALRLNSFGDNVSLISSVGDDEDGENLLNHIASSGINVNGIQISNQFKTGEVNVVLDKKGSASYNIDFPCAWDNIIFGDELIKTVKNSDAFVFGSLVARNNISKNTLLKLLESASYKFFDVNLRAPHYSMAILRQLMQKADFIKFNDDELFQICNQLGNNSNSIKQNIEFISKATNTNTVCVTLGSKGAILFINNTFFENSGYFVEVKDTVGAGDSFLASIIHKLLEDNNPQEALDFACAIGAIVARENGANPKITKKELSQFIK